MKNIVTVDFETYWDDEFRADRLTTEEYVRDPRFEVIGVAVKILDGPPVWCEADELRSLARSIDWSGVAVVAHHAHFEGLILSHHFGIRPGFWFDTLSMDRARFPAEPHDLGSIAARFGLGSKGDAPDRYRGLRRADMTPDQWLDYGEYAKNDVELEWQIFRRLAGEFPISELRLIDATVRMFSEPVLEGDEWLLAGFHRYEVERRAALLERLGLCPEDLRSEAKFAEILRAKGIEPPTKPTGSRRGWTYQFAKTDPFMQTLVEHPDAEIAELAAARLALRSTQTYTRAGRLLAAARRGPLPVYLSYSAAHTHRWGGGDKVNWQNFERVERGKNGLPIGWSGAIRRSIRAPDGQLLRVADLSQIEARVTALLAGETWLLEAFAAGRDVYSEVASDVFGRPVDRKKNPEDFIPGFIGKTLVLGLGFGMGWAKFAFEILKGALGGPPVLFTAEDAEKTGVDVRTFASDPKHVARALQIMRRVSDAEIIVHAAVCKAFVDRYRAKIPRIVEFWSRCDTAISWMAAGAEGAFDALGLIRTAKESVLLPGGLPLWYPGLRRHERGWEFRDGPRTWSKLYGGKFCENLVQAYSRNVIAHHLLQLLDAGHRVVMFTHDELVTCGPAETADRDYQEMVRIMSTAPDWAPGLPLAVEGGVGKTYGDIK